jgi:hypothetical protein
MIDLRVLGRRAIAPEQEFRILAGEAPRMGPSVARLLLLRSPLAFLEMVLMYWGFLRLYRNVANLDGPLWNLVLQRMPSDLNPEDIRYFLKDLPTLPTLGRVLPWLLLAAPLYVLSLWLHDAVWDHGCLWMLGGLKTKRGFRMSLLADSEALQVGAFGAALGLLTSLPTVGWVLSFPVGIVGAYFWILRGFALAAFHGCPTWKGVVATVLHVLLAACMGLGMVLLFALLLRGIV